MDRLAHRSWLFAALAILAVPAAISAQGGLAEYRQAAQLRERLDGLTANVAGDPTWIGSSNRFWYRKSVRGGHEFVLVDAASRQKGAAFDHERLAASLGAARDTTYSAIELPFAEIEFVEGERALQVEVADSVWRCSMTDYACTNAGPRPRQGGGPQGGPGPGGQREEPRLSPDGELEAFVRNHNIAVRPVGSDSVTMLSHDGSEGNAYALRSIEWSPDSRKLAAYRVIPGYRRMVHYIESSPEEQLQPLHSERSYRKPGDVLDVQQPVVFDVATREQIPVDDGLFPNPYSLTEIEWREDSRAFTFEYNQRGHQVYRVIEVDATSGRARAVVSEEEDTFFYYRAASGNQRDSGSRFRFDVDDGREVIWMSERDGWTHLYLYDGVTGEVKHQITKGEWVVRAVDSVDVAQRRIWFRAGGLQPDQDPYFVHHYSIGFDGTGLVAYTEADGNHTVTRSPDGEFYVDRWSRVDLAPVMELRRMDDRSVVMELERGDFSAQLETGWRPPEVFVSKGRDGVTDIWGIIVRPTNFDPDRTYPVVEQIYAGPQGSFVPKDFSPFSSLQTLAELGFVVVQIDGMGTANRSKAFHDVAWRNLGDAGFPDRLAWHRAVAAKYAYYDTTRVGIYGGSAGGQNALGALLFHGDFYKAAVSSAGCHDNRMDKIWWNELWMGWPLAPHYEASSNVVNAPKLQGKLLLVVGEMDTNVDPASTLQVVNALIRADKYFDLLFIPGGGHGSGGDYGTRKRYDFFVENLLGVKPPDWTAGVTLAADGQDELDFDEDDDDAPPSFFDRPDPDHPPGGSWAWQ